MNITDFDILNTLENNSIQNQQQIAKLSGYSVGKVNQSIKKLKNKNYITNDYQLTAAAYQLAQTTKPKNAVILAAGYGLRMVPINREIPKGLLEVDQEPLIERLIKQLHSIGVTEISIIVGFMKEAYEYLIDKYDVELVVNIAYSAKNNLHSLNLVREQLGNTYIVPCDLWAEENPFSKNEWYSWYLLNDTYSEESYVRINRKKELVRTDKSGQQMLGFAYITAADAPLIQTRLADYDEKSHYNDSFWEETLINQNNKLIIAPKLNLKNKVVEINTYEDLRELDQNSRNLESNLLNLIAEIFECPVAEIKNISAIKKGMTNRSFFFTCYDQKYIMRIPGEGTDELINRQEEHAVYQAIQPLQISDEVIYFNEKNGYKITKFVDNARNCNPLDPTDVKNCLQTLKKLHQANLKVDHTFDLFEMIEFYENLWHGAPSCYRDYAETKQKVLSLQNYLNQQPIEYRLCHIDANHDNFLISENEINLIDWEYAAMQDPDLDLAMFAIYALYNRQQVDQLIDLYYENNCPLAVRIKIYCYISICGLLWSNWCEFKRHEGVEFGEYSLRQYRYAKDFYRFATQEMEKLNS